MSQPQTGAPGTTYDEPTGWTGWIMFAAIMFMIAGFLQMFYGFVALFNDEWVVWGQEAALFLDITGWAWVHIIWGILVILIGLLLLRGNMFARVIAVIAASISLIVNFIFIPVFPLWAIIVIVLDALVIWAVVVHGREMKSIR